MEEDDLYGWLEKVFTSLPRMNKEEYNAIWQNRGLRFNKQGKQADLVDEISARFIANALYEKQQLLIVLPDYMSHRGPLLFATALLLESMYRIRSHMQGGQVLYFGSTVGIREHLSNIYINNLCLASVFVQANMQRSSMQVHKFAKNNKRIGGHAEPFNLPKVSCIYWPRDPAMTCKQNKADWFAVDCGSDTKLPWLVTLVTEAKRCNIPLISWIQNPLSKVVEDFRTAGGQVLAWPAIDAKDLPMINLSISSGLRKIFVSDRKHSIQPIIMEVSSTETAIKNLKSSYLALSQVERVVHAEKTNRLALGAIQVGWKYLRSLENLCVPLLLFDAETENLWGANSLKKMRRVLEKYISLLDSNTNLCSQLNEAQIHLQAVHDQFEKQEPPLWKELSNLCVKSALDGSTRFLIFQTAISKKIFELALLAYYNITPDDLKQIHIKLVSMREMYDLFSLLSQNEEIKPQSFSLAALVAPNPIDEYIIVGLPSWTSTPYIDPILRQTESQFILYSYQELILERRIVSWEKALYPSVTELTNNIALTSYNFPENHYSGVVKKIELLSPHRHDLSSLNSGRSVRSNNTSIWEPTDPLDEFAFLMHDSADEDVPLAFSQIGDNIVDTLSEYVETAWHIVFTNGQSVWFSAESRVNIIVSTSSGSKANERYISSLHTGDRIVFVHGQQVQSLLSLVISRVYRNPSITLHVKLVERWREDFVTAYLQYVPNRHKWTPQLLFNEMKIRGSKLVSVQSIRTWLHGETLRPQDEEDLRRVAEILNLKFVRENYKRIHQAGNRLAGLHIGLSRRLNNWLSQDALDIAANLIDQDDMIDEQLGLTFYDFREALSILEVKSVRKETGMFTREMFGHLEREDIR